jgi:hypothetical protein
MNKIVFTKLYIICMKYKKVIINGTEYTNQSKIETSLNELKFHWVVDAEFENAEFEIKNNTIIWENGTWLYGNWHFGIWLNGIFHGIWENGIFEDGEMKGEFQSGINNLKKE